MSFLKEMANFQLYHCFLIGILFTGAEIQFAKTKELAKICQDETCQVLAGNRPCSEDHPFLDKHCPGYCEGCAKETGKRQVIKLVGNCTDEVIECKAWTEIGECNEFPEPMKRHCPFSCGYCTFVENCTDEVDKCQEWAKNGECNEFYESMKRHCPLSCNHCKFDSLCLDSNKQCAEFAANGECMKNRTFMLELCPVSCGYCNNLCLDTSRQCAQLAKDGECEKNSIYMLEVCPLSCGKCDGLCLDRNKACPRMAANGDCDTNLKYMIENCPASCNMCSNLNTGGLCNSHRFLNVLEVNEQSHLFVSGAHHGISKNHVCRKKTSIGFEVGHAARWSGQGELWCFTTWQGGIFETSQHENYEILINPQDDNLIWVQADGKTIPAGTILGGVAAGEPLLVSRCPKTLGSIGTTLHEVPGYVFQNSPTKGFYGFSPKEFYCDDFQFLTCTERRPEGFCMDRNKKCKKYADNGECSKKDILIQCPDSCGECEKSGSCLDRSLKCMNLATSGECDRNGTFAFETCPYSCNICHKDCEDKHYDCDFWVEAGKCQAHSAKMKQHCAKSCKFCKKFPLN